MAHLLTSPSGVLQLLLDAQFAHVHQDKAQTHHYQPPYVLLSQGDMAASHRLTRLAGSSQQAQGECCATMLYDKATPMHPSASVHQSINRKPVPEATRVQELRVCVSQVVGWVVGCRAGVYEEAGVPSVSP
jgi:hypothetical protein